MPPPGRRRVAARDRQRGRNSCAPMGGNGSRASRQRETGRIADRDAPSFDTHVSPGGTLHGIEFEAAGCQGREAPRDQGVRYPVATSVSAHRAPAGAEKAARQGLDRGSAGAARQAGRRERSLVQSAPEPLVSVVTPVYNGAAYLAECIESVLAQTYSSWEYVILDNCSTDRTGEIARRYASGEPRIRVVRNDEVLPIIPNWNRALRELSPDSRYCKVVHADDCLFPECIERMVELAEANPKVGVVGSYRLDGNVPRPSPGLPYTSPVISGIEICRGTLRSDYSLFGSPSTLLLRSGLVRERDPFYDEAFLHADKAVCFDLLEHCDFGFVPQLLTYTRIHEESQSASRADRYGTRRIENFLMLREYGPRFLPAEELHTRLAAAERRYYRFLVRRILRPGGREILRYHRDQLKRHGLALRTSAFVAASLHEALAQLLHPGRIVRRIAGLGKSSAMRSR